MQITNSNYFSHEAGLEYLNVSQFKAFQSCEFTAYHQYVTGKYIRPGSDAFLIGSYVDAYFSGEFDEFVKRNEDSIYSKPGKMYVKFIDADRMIERIKSDPMFLSRMTGEKQIILTPVINGVKWKCKPDFVNLEHTECIDLKTTKGFGWEWSDKHKQRVPFFELYNYPLQLAVYQEALRQEYDKEFKIGIAAVTKEKQPDIALLSFDSDEWSVRFKHELDQIKEYQSFIVSIKNNEIPESDLRRCETCAYCKQTKILQGFEEAVIV